MPEGTGHPQPALLVDAVSKRFGDVTALAAASIAVANGLCFGLLGPNGAGKSTLIRSIVGRTRPDSGTIQVFGQPADSTAARALLGWVPQELALYPLLTVQENLDTFGRYQGLRHEKLAEAIAWCLEWAGLGDRANSLMKTLSGGMKRRLNLAAGIIHRPRLVLLDEPTVGVDPQSRNRIFEMIDDLRRQGATIIYTTHYMEEAERLCDRIAILDHAHIIAEGTKDELITRSFGGRYDVAVSLAGPEPVVSEWARVQGGTLKDGRAHFSIARPVDIAPLLTAATGSGLEVNDVALHRPNLESVFLQLTGRELRE
ncbi:MAG TPA: ABC transporter ATP-binding protein [Rhizomicrobium sp.]|jgi:ABC-2 type transport system ATP-binding protein|nr:ABC transporter ATP-binding protein [Rhizomicrobium sp.]